MRRRRIIRSLVVWAALALLAWLDRGRAPIAQQAGLFSVIWAGISAVSSWLGAAGGAIATTLESTVLFLSRSFGWLAGRVADILSNTGTMFAKVWESARTFYDDVLRPALTWLHDFYESVRSWLTRVLKPILQWAQRVRSELQSLYKRFVSPILRALDVSRKVLDILAQLHVPFARALDQKLSEVEQVIVENYLRILGYVNRAINTINSIVTLDLLFQRFPFVRTLERDAFYVWRVVQNSHHRPLTSAEHDTLSALAKGKHLAVVQAEFSQYLDSSDGPLADAVADGTSAWAAYFGDSLVADDVPVNA